MKTEISSVKGACDRGGSVFEDYFKLHTGPRPRWHPPYQSWPFWCDDRFARVRSLRSCLDKRRRKNARIRCTNSFTRASLIATSVQGKSTLGDVQSFRRFGETKKPRRRRCRRCRRMETVRRLTTNWPNRSVLLRRDTTRTCDVHDGHDYDDDGYDGRVSRTAPSPARGSYGACPARQTACSMRVQDAE